MNNLVPHPVVRAGARPLAMMLTALLATAMAGGVAAAPASTPRPQGAPAPAAPAPRWGPDRFGGYASDHVIIKVKPGVVASKAPNGQPTLRPNAAAPKAPAGKPALAPPRPDPALNVLDQLARQWGVNSIAPAIQPAPLNKALAARIGLDRYYRVNVPRGTDTPRFVAALANLSSLIESAELDGLGGLATVIPNDPDFNLLYGLYNIGQTIVGQPGLAGADIDAPHAWDISVGSANLTLAVIDSGVDPHVEIGDRLLTGWYVIDQTTDTSDQCDHGTHVSGTAAATGNNGVGIAGVAWNVKILPVRVLEQCMIDSVTGEANTASGLVWATDHGARVANMSLQWFAGTSVLHDAVIYAHDSGLVLIAASGNQGLSSVTYPAKWPETIAVAATNNLDQRWVLSNFGPEIDVSAPGVSIWSLLNTTQYKFVSGTSMAAAHVSGAACLALSINPGLTNEQVRAVIEQTADDVGAAGFDVFTGHGRLNAAAVAARARQLLADFNHDGHINGMDLAILLAAWGNCPALPAPCPPDLNASGTVNGLDLAMLLSAWG